MLTDYDLAFVFPFIKNDKETIHRVEDLIRQSPKSCVVAVANSTDSKIAILGNDNKFFSLPCGFCQQNNSRLFNYTAKKIRARYFLFAHRLLVYDPSSIFRQLNESPETYAYIPFGFHSGTNAGNLSTQIVIVTNWLHTKIQGFNESIGVDSVGPGGEFEDYITRLQMAILDKTKIGTIDSSSVTVCPATDKELCYGYSVDSYAKSLVHNLKFSAEHIKQHGYLGNPDRSWGCECKDLI